MKPAPSFTDVPAPSEKALQETKNAKTKKYVRADGLTEDDFKVGDIVGWDTATGMAGGKIVLYGRTKVVMTSTTRYLPLADVIASPSLRKLN